MATSLHNMGNLLKNMGSWRKHGRIPNAPLPFMRKNLEQNTDLAPDSAQHGWVLESMGELVEARPYANALSPFTRKSWALTTRHATSLNNMVVFC
ncbi:MAG: hypothetical protein IPL28_21515 [Chloroflexi bacterium]|nr:hypothetical protein [Chloroflexota bacterium]